MGLQYYIDNTLPQNTVADLVTFFEALTDKCPSDAFLNFCMLSVGGRLILEVTLNSAAMQFKESLEGRSISGLKRALENVFKSRIESWRQSRSDVALA